MNRWTPEWAEMVIDALGEFHDEEECDGPEDLLREIASVCELARAELLRADGVVAPETEGDE
jgi:hypothetical protein